MPAVVLMPAVMLGEYISAKQAEIAVRRQQNS